MYKKCIPYVIIVVLAIGLIATYNRGSNIRLDYQKAIANMKAYDAIIGQNKGDMRALQLNIDQLMQSNDSLLRKMDSLRRAQGIKDNDLKVLQYLSSKVEKTDTLILMDTIFVKDMLNVDTIVRDAWYNMRIKLKYPNYIVVTPRFYSQKYITVHTKKETVNPPKKCWFLRLFQKKHKVVTVDVYEESPYITDSISRYVEIVK